MSFRSKLYYLREYLFPAGCGGCGEALSPVDACYGLCQKCRTSFGIALVAGKRCRYCGKPLITEKEICLSCREKAGAENGSYDGHIKKLIVLFPYVGKFRTILGSFKFEKSTGLGFFFAGYLKLALEALEPETLERAVWVPVPPRPGKIKKYGWDQVEFLAKLLDKTVGFTHGKAGGVTHGKNGRMAVNRCLKRLPSKSQKLLNREERERNLKGRIRCVKTPPETALLFDDVVTTGATLDACAEALLQNGAKSVYAVCLFYK